MSNPQNISLIRRNRANLRARGLNGSDIQMLEEIALQMRSVKMKTLRGSYLGKCLGVSAQWANRVCARLAALGLITRFKTGLTRLNTEKLHDICAKTARFIRRKPTKWLKAKRKLETRNNGVHNKDINTKRDCEMVIPDRATARKELKATYIPVHLRQSNE